MSTENAAASQMETKTVSSLAVHLDKSARCPDTVTDKPIYLAQQEPALFEDKTHLDTLREMRALKPEDVPALFKGKHGEDVHVTLTARGSNCSKAFVWSDGTVQDVRADGTMRFEYRDGRGFEGASTPEGGWRERHWGTGPFDNQIRLYVDPTTTIVTSLDGLHGYNKEELPHSVHVHHWGTEKSENYESEWKGHYEYITNADGTKEVVPR